MENQNDILAAAQTSAVQTPQALASHAVEFKALRKSYGKVDALRGLELAVRPGEVMTGQAVAARRRIGFVAQEQTFCG